MLGDEKIQCLMYADDLVRMSLSAQGLQQQLDSLNEYCEKWELCVNIKKTKVVIIFGHSNSKEKMPPFYLDGRCLEIVSCYKYLGVELHQNLNWTSTSKNLCTKACKAVYKLKSMSAGLDIPPRKMVSIYDKVIKLIMCCNSEIWGAMNNCVSYDIRDETVFWEKLNVRLWRKCM